MFIKSGPLLSFLPALAGNKARGNIVLEVRVKEGVDEDIKKVVCV